MLRLQEPERISEDLPHNDLHLLGTRGTGAGTGGSDLLDLGLCWDTDVLLDPEVARDPEAPR